MIICKLQGGLGNQMFQFAYAKHLSEKFSTSLKLDTRFYDFDLTPRREFLLSLFPKIQYDTNLDIQFNEPIYKIDDNFEYKSIPKPVGCNYYLDGYWQSEKYFKDSEGLIRELFKPSQEVIDNIKATPFIDLNCVSLHVRRTDYLESNGYHPVQTPDYYNQALEIIGDYDYVFVFSDDINWCKENLKFKNIVFMTGLHQINDLYAMSLCKHNIVANSSFSWWGAWLNKNPNKKVIAPKKWFGPNVTTNDSDIVPNTWIKI